MQLCSISMSKMFMQRTLAKWMQMMVDHRHRHFTLLFPLPGRKRSKIFACFLASHYGGFSSDAIYWEWSFLTIPFHEVPQTPCSILPCLVFIALWSLVTVCFLHFYCCSFEDVCMYAQLLQSCLTLCDSMDCSPQTSYVQGIILELNFSLFEIYSSNN